MTITVKSTIILTINGQTFELSQNEAQQIYDLLGGVLGKTIPGSYFPPQTATYSIPCGPYTPTWDPKKFDITCEAK